MCVSLCFCDLGEEIPPTQGAEEVKNCNDDDDEEKSSSQSSQELDPEIIDKSEILSVEALGRLISICPDDVEFFPWMLAWSVRRNGTSMFTFYERLINCVNTLMLIEDKNHNVFGAYFCEEWHRSNNYYGKNGSFVFKLSEGGGVYVWRASNGNDSFYQFSSDSIFVGIKDRSAIYLSINFALGSTSCCTTFGSPPLIGNTDETVQFDVLSIEIWAPSYDFCQVEVF